MAKARVNLSLDQDLVDFVKTFAAENRMTVADVVTQYLLSLRRRSVRERTATILANPALRSAMEEAQTRLRDGRARWHDFDEVFGG